MLRSVFPSLLVLIATSLPSVAQQGAISGVVFDPAGARIANATLRLRQSSNNTIRSGATNDEGLFRFADLWPGTYQVSATHLGFAEATISVLVNVGERKTVMVVLPIEATTESVVVTSTVSASQRDGGSLSTIVSQELVHHLPVNGRSFQTLLDLTPGLVLVPTNTTDHGSFSVNGQRPTSNYLTVDGVSGNVGIRGQEGGNQELNGSIISTGMAGGSQGVVSIDEVQEFRVQTSSFAPEYGRTPGAQIQVATRSGTNSLHGSIYNYFRNDYLDAADWFVNSKRLPKPPLRQNDIGGVVGGPIVRDRLFGFGSVESLHLVQPKTGNNLVPSDSARNSASNAIARVLLSSYPLANQPEQTTTAGRFSTSYGNPTRADLLSLRTDFVPNERLHMFLRAAHGPGSGYQGFGVSRSQYGANNSTVTAGLTMSLTPAINNDLRLNYSAASRQYSPSPQLVNGAQPFDVSLIIPSFDPSRQWVNFQTTGAFTNITQGTRADNMQRQFNIVDTADYLAGRHHVRFGADIRLLRPQVFSGSNILVVFNNLDQINAAVASRVRQTQTQENVTVRYGNYSFFAQDTWQIAARLNLTYGLRWELNPPPSDSTGGPPAILGSFADPNGAVIALTGHRPFRTQWGAVAPRLGIAWNVKAGRPIELTVRAGGGVFYDLSASGAVGSSGALAATQTTTNVPLLGYSFPYPTETSLPLSPLHVADPRIRLSRTYQWNSTVEVGIGDTNHISLSYVGAVGRNLIRNHSYTGLTNPIASLMAVYQSDGSSDYHALQAQYRRAAGRLVEAVASYTFGKSLDDASNQTTVPPTADMNSRNDRGLSDFDVRHQATAGIVIRMPTAMLQERWVRTALGGWTLSPFIRVRTGLPFSVLSNLTFDDNTLAKPRANLVAGQPVWLSDPAVPTGKRLNYSAFANPEPGRQGNLGRNTFVGFGLAQVDANVSRTFYVLEKVAVTASIDVFNITNHPNFGPPNATLVSPLSFGIANSLYSDSLGSPITGGLNSVYQSGGSRSLQVSLRIAF